MQEYLGDSFRNNETQCYIISDPEFNFSSQCLYTHEQLLNSFVFGKMKFMKIELKISASTEIRTAELSRRNPLRRPLDHGAPNELILDNVDPYFFLNILVC